MNLSSRIEHGFSGEEHPTAFHTRVQNAGTWAGLISENVGFAEHLRPVHGNVAVARSANGIFGDEKFRREGAGDAIVIALSLLGNVDDEPVEFFDFAHVRIGAGNIEIFVHNEDEITAQVSF